MITMKDEETPDIELVGDADCPNMGLARESLERALLEVGLPVRWTERIQPPVAGSGSPDEAGRLPSPTILVDGEDVEAPVTGAGCRLYRDADGDAVGAPPVKMVVEALRQARGGSGSA